jgi:hypothetical protein
VPQIPIAAIRTTTSPGPWLLEVYLPDLERLSGAVEERRAGLHRPSAEITSSHLTTLDTFWSA